MTESTRRALVNVTGAVAGTALIARVSHAQEIVSNDDATAFAIAYAVDHTTDETAKHAKQATPGGKNQKSTDCTIYQRIDVDYRLCHMLAGKRGGASGWCNGLVA